MSEFVLDSFVMLIMFIIALFGIFLFCRFLATINEDNRDTKIYAKCLPIVSLIMTLFSVLPFFSGFFKGADDGFMDNAAWPIIICFISMIFTCIWVNMFFASHHYAKKLFQDGR